MRERWIEAVTSRAAAYWTPKRQASQLGDRRQLLPVVEAAPLWRVLGLLNGDGSMSRGAVRKTAQINHMVALLEPVFEGLMREHDVVRVLDVACGSSYLTLALAWCFEHRWDHPCRILGVDRNDAVVERSGERAHRTLLDCSLKFEASSIRDLDVATCWARGFDEPVGIGDVHALVALHACDTATDEALALGVALEADFIGAVPCCHAELAQAWEGMAEAGATGALAPIWASPHLRREAAATLTDAMRTLLLRANGYWTTPMEFVSSTHTPKNTLLRASRGGDDRERAVSEYRDLQSALGGVTLELERRLGPPGESP